MTNIDIGKEATWSDPNRVAEYLSREIPHRLTAERMLLEALPGQVERFLDLGTGDGRLLALVLGHHPQARGIGRVEDDPSDHLADLADQLSWLREAGFDAVDCHFKWLEMALFIAEKPAGLDPTNPITG